MRTQSWRWCQVLALVSGGVISASAMAGVEVVGLVNTHAPASNLSQVPGGLAGAPDARFTNFNNKLYRTPTTNKWVVVATTNATPATADQVLLLGSGRTCTVMAREGVTSFGLDNGGQPAYINFSRLDTPRFNDADQWAMGFRPANAQAFEERLIKWDGSAFSVTKPGDAAPGDGNIYTGSFSAAGIANDGSTGFLASISPLDQARKSAVLGNNRLFEMLVTVPAGQSEPATAWTDIDSNLFYADATGTHWIAVGKVGFDTAVDRVVVLDGTVIIQKGSILAGSGFTSPVNSISTANDGVWMESDGTWFAWGVNVDGQAWLVRNGVVIAKSGEGITPGSTETWETFRAARGDNNGNWIINGNTNNPTLTDDVLVLNGQTVIARESEPVDLDGDGAFNDSLYLHLVQNHSVLMDDGYAYFAARLKSDPTATAGVGGSTGASLLRVRAFVPQTCGTSDYNGDGDYGTDADIEAFFACLGGVCCETCFPGGSDFNADGDYGTDADIESFFRVLGGGPC